jgi:hypothetical protein
MKYLKKTFSVPAGSNKITQEHWDSIFSCQANNSTSDESEKDSAPSAESESPSEESPGAKGAPPLESDDSSKLIGESNGMLCLSTEGLARGAEPQIYGYLPSITLMADEIRRKTPAPASIDDS